MGITFTNPLSIDGTYYNVIAGDLKPQNIDNFIKSADPSWEIR